MKTWTRARYELHCGMCRGVIPAGHPVLLLQLPGLRYQPKRCGACAQRLGEAMPADLPRAAPPPPERDLTPLRDLIEPPIKEAPPLADVPAVKTSAPRAIKKPPPAFKRKAHAR